MNETNGRPRVGIALGGGVVRGLAHIGVLAELEDAASPSTRRHGVGLSWARSMPPG